MTTLPTFIRYAWLATVGRGFRHIRTLKWAGARRRSITHLRCRAFSRHQRYFEQSDGSRAARSDRDQGCTGSLQAVALAAPDVTVPVGPPQSSPDLDPPAIVQCVDTGRFNRGRLDEPPDGNQHLPTGQLGVTLVRLLPAAAQTTPDAAMTAPPTIALAYRLNATPGNLRRRR